MGLSIYANIAYGVSYDPETEDVDWMDAHRDEDDDFDWEQIVARHAGLEPLDYSDYPERPRYPANRNDRETFRQAEDEYRKARNEWRKRVGADEYYARKREIIAACPLSLDYAGHCDNPIYVLHLSGTLRTVYWSPEPLHEDTLRADDRDIARAKAFAAELNIPWSNPDWLLYPYYSH